MRKQQCSGVVRRDSLTIRIADSWPLYTFSYTRATQATFQT